MTDLPIDRSLAASSGFFVGGRTLQETLDRVIGFAEQAIPPSAMTGITMLVEGKPTTASFTNAEAPEIDAAQYKTGAGPCLEAFRAQRIIVIDDTTADDRWPEFCDAAFEHGVR